MSTSALSHLARTTRCVTFIRFPSSFVFHHSIRYLYSKPSVVAHGRNTPFNTSHLL
jgi:hypothetical protein